MHLKTFGTTSTDKSDVQVKYTHFNNKFFISFVLWQRKIPQPWGKPLNPWIVVRAVFVALTGVGSASTPFTVLPSNFNYCSIRGWCNCVRYNKTSCSSIIYCRLGKQYCFFFNQVILNILSVRMLNAAIFDISLPKKKIEIKIVSYWYFMIWQYDMNTTSKGRLYFSIITLK